MLDATAVSGLTLLNILTKELHLRTAKHSLQNEDICRMAALRIVTTSHHCYLQGQVQAAISGSQWQGLLLEGSTRDTSISCSEFDAHGDGQISGLASIGTLTDNRRCVAKDMQTP
jgi:hypothetical protein